MCLCWTLASGFGPVWIVGSPEYVNLGALVRSETDGLGTVKVHCTTPVGLKQTWTARLADIQFNPLVEARDLFPFPPPPDCGWPQWCYIHKIEPRHRICCHFVAEFWWRLSPADHCFSTGEGMTKDNAVLFCWLNGNKFKKRSTTELVHYHLVQTSEKMHSMHARRKKGTETQQITDNMLERVMPDSCFAFRLEADTYSSKYRCGGCLEQCTGRKSFRLCERCKQVRYCSEDCQKTHWTESHRHECQQLQRVS